MYIKHVMVCEKTDLAIKLKGEKRTFHEYCSRFLLFSLGALSAMSPLFLAPKNLEALMTSERPQTRDARVKRSKCEPSAPISHRARASGFANRDCAGEPYHEVLAPLIASIISMTALNRLSHGHLLFRLTPHSNGIVIRRDLLNPI